LAKHKSEVKPKNVMVTMIFFREKEEDKNENQRKKTSEETPVNIDFPKGTTVAEAKEEQELLRQTGNKFASKYKYSKT
jgi:hypothetical protein